MTLSVRDLSPWARDALSPEARAVLEAVKPLTTSRFLSGSSPGGPWTFWAYVPDPVPESPFRVREIRLDGGDINVLVLAAAKAVKEAARA